MCLETDDAITPFITIDCILLRIVQAEIQELLPEAFKVMTADFHRC